MKKSDVEAISRTVSRAVALVDAHGGSSYQFKSAAGIISIDKMKNGHLDIGYRPYSSQIDLDFVEAWLTRGKFELVAYKNHRGVIEISIDDEFREMQIEAAKKLKRK
jgi:hypothetical protein